MTTYFSRVVYPAGGNNPYTVTFPYLDRAHIVALDNGAAYTGTISWNSPTQVTLTPDIAAGHTVTIARSTPKTPLVAFAGGPVPSSSLNLATIQAIYLTQELFDAGFTGSAIVGGGVAQSGFAIGLFSTLSSTTVPAGVTLISSSGYSSLGKGAALYRETLASDPDFSGTVTAYRKQDAAGRWFILAEPELTPEMFGALGDGTTDDTTALQAAFDSLSVVTINSLARKRRLTLSAGVYRTTAQLNIASTNFTIAGAGPRQSEILGDFTTGAVIKYTGTGDVRFRDFAVNASSARTAGSAVEANSGIVCDPGASSSTTTLRTLFTNMFLTNQPGCGLMNYNPELTTCENISTSGNGLDGLYLYGRDLGEINCRVSGGRHSGNGRFGVQLQNMTSTSVINVACLNNLGSTQLYLNNCEFCTVSDADLEAFNLVSAGSSYYGITLSGRGNKILGGNFFGLNKGIRCLNADGTTIIGPKFFGRTALIPMAVGVEFGGGSDRNLLIMDGFSTTNVTDDYTDVGAANTVSHKGQWTFPALAFPVDFHGSLSGTFTPDAAKTFYQLDLVGNLTIAAPTGLYAGQELVFIIRQDATGGRNVTWDTAYRNAWSDTGNLGGLACTIRFRFPGTATGYQEGAQSPWY